MINGVIKQGNEAGSVLPLVEFEFQAGSVEGVSEKLTTA